MGLWFQRVRVYSGVLKADSLRAHILIHKQEAELTENDPKAFF